MNKSITFFFPYHILSGVPVLFLNLAEYISSNFNYEVYIVDYKDGYMARNREKKSKVKLIEFENGNLIKISNTILVMQAILPYAMRPELKISKNTKVFFWNLYPDIFFPIVFPFNLIESRMRNNIKYYKIILNFLYYRTFKKIKDFVAEMHKYKTLIFMDSSNLDRTNEILGLNLSSETFLPISCESNVQIINNIVSKKNELNISWVGRICDFKVNILKYTILKLDEISRNKKQKIVFHVIGNGPEINEIQNILINNDYFNLQMVGVIPKNQLDQYLLDKIDINAAMGTSALESAKLGIPTIILDISHNKIQGDYLFRWLHETINFDLGHVISKLDINDNNTSLQKIILNFVNEKDTLQEKTIEYFKKNHSIDSVSNKLINFVENDSLKFENINNFYFKKNFLRKVYEYKLYKIWS